MFVLALSLALSSCTAPSEEATGQTTHTQSTVADENTSEEKAESETLAETEAETEKPGFLFDEIEINREISATYAAVLDIDANTVLYEKGGMDTRLYPASTTKLITALVALKYCDVNEVFTAGEEVNMIAADSSIAYIKRGHALTLDMLIAAMLLPSGNDAAYVVAAGAGRIIAGKSDMTANSAVRVFVNEMNDFAEENGLTGSHFTCPDGYHDDEHYTTLHDMLLIGKLATENETIMKHASTPSLDVTYHSGEINSWTNTNHLINPSSSFYYKFATGLKTGTTNEAGCCLMVSAEKDGKKMITCVFDSDSNDRRFSDALVLLKATLGTR